MATSILASLQTAIASRSIDDLDVLLSKAASAPSTQELSVAIAEGNRILAKLKNIKVSLKDVLAHPREHVVVELLRDADGLNYMFPEYEYMLSIKRVLIELRLALESGEVGDLEAALASASALQPALPPTTTMLTKAQAALDKHRKCAKVLEELRDAVNAEKKSEQRLQALLEEVLSLGLNPNKYTGLASGLLRQIAAIRSRINEVLGQCKFAENGKGLTEQHILDAEKALENAEKFGGLEEAEEVGTLRSMLAAIEVEYEKIDMVEEGLSHGAWLFDASLVTRGDYDQYPPAAIISTTALREALESLEATKLFLAESRDMVSIGRGILLIRAKAMLAIGTGDRVLWNAVEDAIAQVENGATVMQSPMSTVDAQPDVSGRRGRMRSLSTVRAPPGKPTASARSMAALDIAPPRVPSRPSVSPSPTRSSPSRSSNPTTVLSSLRAPSAHSTRSTDSAPPPPPPRAASRSDASVRITVENCDVAHASVALSDAATNTPTSSIVKLQPYLSELPLPTVVPSQDSSTAPPPPPPLPPYAQRDSPRPLAPPPAPPAMLPPGIDDDDDDAPPPPPPGSKIAAMHQANDNTATSSVWTIAPSSPVPSFLRHGSVNVASMDVYYRERLAKVLEYLGMSAEVRAIKEELEYQKMVQRHVALLHIAYEKYDLNLLDDYITLAQCPPLNMQMKYSPQLRAAVKRRDETRVCKTRLEHAMESTEPAYLCEAITFAQNMGYPEEGMSKARELYESVYNVTSRAQQALQDRDIALMRQIVAEATVLKISNQVLQSVHAHLNKLNSSVGSAGMSVGAGSREALLQLKQQHLDAMDMQNVAKVDIELRKLEIRSDKDKYKLDVCEEVLDKADWSNEKFFCWDRLALAEGMLMYTEEEIHHPLTTMAQCIYSSKDEQKKSALELFSLLVKYGIGDACAFDVLMFMKGTHHIANELFTQLMKQLTAVPVGAVRDRYWRLFGLMLTYFGPSGDAFQRSVHEFLVRREAFELEELLMKRLFPMSLPPNERPISSKARMFASSTLNEYDFDGETHSSTSQEQPKFVPNSTLHIVIPNTLTKEEVEASLKQFPSPPVTADERKANSKHAVKRLRCFFF